MRNTLRALMAAAALIAAAPAAAQVQQQDATVATGVVQIPNGPATSAPNTVPFASASIRTFTYQPVCELRREQFQDENGWRVRDVRVCR